MFYFKRKADVRLFKILLRALPKNDQIEIELCISLFVFFKFQIENEFFPLLKKELMLEKIPREIEDLVYKFLLLGMNYKEIDKKMPQFIMMNLILLRDEKEVVLTKPRLVNDIDLDPNVSYLQLLSRIYEKLGKELPYSERNEKLFEKYETFMECFISGTLKGISRSSFEDISRKVDDELVRFSKAQLDFINNLIGSMLK